MSASLADLWICTFIGMSMSSKHGSTHECVRDQRALLGAVRHYARSQQLGRSPQPHHHPVLHVAPVLVLRHNAATRGHNQVAEGDQLLMESGTGFRVRV